VFSLAVSRSDRPKASNVQAVPSCASAFQSDIRWLPAIRLTTLGQADLARQRKTVEKFLAAIRAGDMQRVLAVLDPNIVHRADQFAAPAAANLEIRGAQAVAEEAMKHVEFACVARTARVNGKAGIIVAPTGLSASPFRVQSKTERSSRWR
jgi:hypothetical protein